MSSVQNQKPQNQYIIKGRGESLIDAQEIQNNYNIENIQFSHFQKNDDLPISLLQYQSKGTNLASESQISKLFNDYEQYKNQYNSKKKTWQATPLKLHQQQENKVFENMINSNNSQYVQPQYSTIQKKQKIKIRSHSNNQSSTLNIPISYKQQIQNTTNNRENQLPLKKENKQYSPRNKQTIQILERKIFNKGEQANIDYSEIDFCNINERISSTEFIQISQRNVLNKENTLNNKTDGSIYENTISAIQQNNTPIKENDNQLENLEIILKNNQKDSPNKQIQIRNRRSQKQAYSALSSPKQRQYEYDNEIFSSNEDITNTESYIPSNQIKTEGRIQNTSQTIGFSNLLKQNSKPSQQYIIPIISQIQNTQQKQNNNDDYQQVYKNSFQQQQQINNINEDYNSNFSNGFKTTQVVISPRKVDEYFNENQYYSSINKQNRENAIRNVIYPKPNQQNSMTINQQKNQSPTQNNDQTNFLIQGYGNNPQISEEEMKNSSDLNGKKYFKNPKIENLIKEYEKRSIRSLFEAQMLLSQKKNQIEISHALEEKRQKEIKLATQNSSGKKQNNESKYNNNQNNSNIPQTKYDCIDKIHNSNESKKTKDIVNNQQKLNNINNQQCNYNDFKSNINGYKYYQEEEKMNDNEYMLSSKEKIKYTKEYNINNNQNKLNNNCFKSNNNYLNQIGNDQRYSKYDYKNELQGNKDNEYNVNDNFQVQSKSAMTNNLERDINHIRNRTKSSLMRRQEETQQNNIKQGETSSFIYGNIIQNQSYNNNQNNKLDVYMINNNRPIHTEFTERSEMNDSNNFRNKFKQQIKQNHRRIHNSIDVALNSNSQENINSLNEKQQKIPLSSRNRYCSPSPFYEQSLKNDQSQAKDQDILDTFLKNINIKKSYTKQYDLQTQIPTNDNMQNNKGGVLRPKQDILDIRAQNNNTNENHQPIIIQNTFNQLFQNEVGNYKSTIQTNYTDKQKYSHQKQKSNNFKTLGAENINGITEQDMDCGGWETQTTSNFDKLYGLFQ